jgi:hypothetical protein
MVEANRVIFYYGRVGSYKTLMAVATAYTLMRSGRFQRCYANIPVSFASSPPKNIDKFDFLDYNYARDSIFIIDESALFLSGKHEEIKEIFAFPRKINQVFLLASVLPTKQITDYAHLFVKRGFNLPLIGLPLVQFMSTPHYKSSVRKEYISHWLFRPNRYYRKYSSKFRPESMYPIRQYRDSGTLYDSQSRVVPNDISKYFILDSWGQAVQKRNLSEYEENLIEQFLPTYDTSDIIDESSDFPAIKQQFSLRSLLSGGEFNISFLLQFLFVIYVIFTIIRFIGNIHGDDIPMQQWRKCEYVQLLRGAAINECKTIPTETQTQSITPTTPTPAVVEYIIE